MNNSDESASGSMDPTTSDDDSEVTPLTRYDRYDNKKEEKNKLTKMPRKTKFLFNEKERNTNLNSAPSDWNSYGGDEESSEYAPS
jgi:hypothetical protein